MQLNRSESTKKQRYRDIGVHIYETEGYAGSYITNPLLKLAVITCGGEAIESIDSIGTKVCEKHE